MTNKRREYTREFKLEAIGLVVDHKRKVAEVAESLGVGISTLDNWVRKYRLEQKGISPTQGLALTDDQRELQELRKQVKRLTMERDILKKASALLALDSLNVYR
ncbi:transposase [Psychrobacter sp. AOP22-C1-22]|jgi:transposase|uniref:transposase n=1 Tax=unclassified Psychrobacter TaxID=196806 RepID=UPI001787A105|nr:transposase [Psychrobacter sp. FME6]MBE0405859.1 transposase [Psychrobacter sp. FME6]